jgi:mercuric ion binding protein
MKHTLVATAVAVFGFGSSLFAGQVKVEGVHLCCGACVKAVTAAFEGVEGVTNVAVDQTARTVTYDAADRKLARGGIQAMAKAGYGGKAMFDGKELPFPKGLMAEAKGNSVTINGIHNCCGGCVKAITETLKGVQGVAEVKCEKKTCTITGTDVSHTALIEALHKSGLHGNIAAAKPAE